ncbi:MAG: tRNA-dihydrouridine synthase family protein [Clostridia bacterium]|nr:tRNA-dihydrouridine synthase family protein [Clostridia bacterium]
MQLKAINIDGLQTPNNVFLAPLAGYTNAVFRKMCYGLGAGLTFTEMVSAKGLCYKSNASAELLFVTEDYGGIKACQLFGGEPEYIKMAAESEHVAPFDLIDLNFGCPVPKIFNNGEGSALLADFDRAGRIIKAARSSGKRVSVKFRIGITEGNFVAADFAKMCEDSGADMLTVHGRTRDKMYAGEVNYGQIEAVKKAVNIPVIANGGVFCEADADKLVNNTVADGVMLARGAMYDPSLFCEITHSPVPDKKQLILKQLEDTLTYYGERFCLVFMRKMVAFYTKGGKNSSALRTKLFACNSVGELKTMIEGVEW